MCNWSMAHYLDGQEKGRIAGIEEGKAMGRTEGKTEEKQNVIRRLNDAGVSIELIATAVALSAAEVLNILS